MTAVFDTHAHLTDPAFAGDLEDVLSRARDSGVVGIALCGYDEPSNEQTLRLAERSKLLHPAVGIHPHDAKDVTPAALRALEAQAALPPVVAVGEIGLDFYRDLSPRAVQHRVLDEQLAIAGRVAKPVCVHSRGAEDDIVPHLEAYASSAKALAEMGRPAGVMHSFGGTLEQALRFVELGFMISFACPITYPKNQDARHMAARLPLDRIVVETDSPYLPPQAQRGTRNEPANVREAVIAIADGRGLPYDEVARATSANASRLFGVAIPAEVAT